MAVGNKAQIELSAIVSRVRHLSPLSFFSFFFFLLEELFSISLSLSLSLSVGEIEKKGKKGEKVKGN
jgi:hypothetical protein